MLKAAKKAKAHNCKVVLNPAPYKELPTELFKYIDIIVPNEHEAAAMTGVEITDTESATIAIHTLMKMGIEQVIITLGDKGSVYNSGNTISFTNARKSNYVDTTAAGDTFIGGLITQLSRGTALNDAIDFATAASAITVSRYGAADSIPFENEILL